MSSLNGKTVLITGAAAGIGREMALLFAREKTRLILLDINKEKLDETAKDLESLGADVSTYICDVSDDKAVLKVTGLIKKNNFVDILINNAGIVIGKSIADSSFGEIKKTVDINLLGLIWMTKQFLPEMMEHGSGHVVNIASAAGLLAVPRMADYCATKFGVVGFTDALRMEMTKFGYKNIKITCICPSVIDTGMFDGFKAPLFNPILKPGYVAKRVVNAVKKGKTYVKIPAMVIFIPLLKVFPASFADWLAGVSGITGAMDNFSSH